jgi:hypothetical protein
MQQALLRYYGNALKDLTCHNNVQTRTDINALSAIRTHDLSVQAIKAYASHRTDTGIGYVSCRSEDHDVSYDKVPAEMQSCVSEKCWLSFRVHLWNVESMRRSNFCCQIYHRHLWHDSPLWAVVFLGFPDNRIFTRWGCQSHAQPPVTPGNRVTQPLGTNFNRLLRHAWATLGLFLSSGHHMENCQITLTNERTFIKSAGPCHSVSKHWCH